MFAAKLAAQSIDPAVNFAGGKKNMSPDLLRLIMFISMTIMTGAYSLLIIIIGNLITYCSMLRVLTLTRYLGVCTLVTATASRTLAVGGAGTRRATCDAPGKCGHAHSYNA